MPDSFVFFGNAAETIRTFYVYKIHNMIFCSPFFNKSKSCLQSLVLLNFYVYTLMWLVMFMYVKNERRNKKSANVTQSSFSSFSPKADQSISVFFWNFVFFFFYYMLDSNLLPVSKNLQCVASSFIL